MRGRITERAEITRLLASVRQGRSRSLVLRGPAGIGKSALIDHAVAAGDELHLIRVDGVEVEQQLGFAALHRLLRPLLGGWDRLPEPQREALALAFGLVIGSPPDRFLVGLSVLTLLADAAADRPLLVVCDDAQWLDDESLDVLAFVARRLDFDAIAMIFGVRHPIDRALPLDGLPELVIERLPEDDAKALLEEDLAAAPLDSRHRVVVDRVLAAAGGNPLALREFAYILTPSATQAGLVEDFLLGGPLPLSRRLEARFLDQVHSHSALAQTALLVAAADATGTVEVVRGAVHQLVTAPAESVTAAFEEAECAGLLVSDPAFQQVRFRHPLIRSAVYGGATASRRRDVHRALAAVIDPVHDADRRAWHLAAAADGPDEAVAAELEQRADRAQDRGGYLAQTAFLCRAADLTVEGRQRNARLLAAAGAAITGGALQRAEDLLDRRNPRLDTPAEAASVLRLRGNLLLATGREGATSLLLDAVELLGPIEPAAARDTLLEAFKAAIVLPRLGPGVTAMHIAQDALKLRLPDSEGERLLSGHAKLIAESFGAAVPILRGAFSDLRCDGTDGDSATSRCLLGIVAAIDLWDIDALGAVTQRYAAAARSQGALRVLEVAAYGQAMWELLCGRFAAAELLFAEFAEIGSAMWANAVYYRESDVMLHAWRGDAAATRSAAAVQAGPSIDVPGPAIVQMARRGLMVLALGTGRYPEAQAVGELILAENPPHYLGTALPDLIEAAVRNGKPAVAERALAELRLRAGASSTPWALGLLARSEAIAAADQEAEALFREAIEQLEKTPVATDRGRTHLLYGEWLRRQRRRGEARAHLNTAHEMFCRMGAVAFAERTQLELLAAGERARKPKESTAWVLTPQEARIARLAAEGATNQEIASELFISASTVEYHLRKVFRKLDVNSRHKLSRSLRGDGGVDRHRPASVGEDHRR
ncbi:LuxR family transcriptional regulator [Actinoplanes sp. RD1]|uniref:LuxR family transcriptional regulator n=1 Tax=Actinoplanes sp. RD1 TaxID=3064538 RepID=UPI0027422EDB|nr:LuxR family transcriptional regulator [Actinoplanes sp. RD1]